MSLEAHAYYCWIDSNMKFKDDTMIGPIWLSWWQSGGRYNADCNEEVDCQWWHRKFLFRTQQEEAKTQNTTGSQYVCLTTKHEGEVKHETRGIPDMYAGQCYVKRVTTLCIHHPQHHCYHYEPFIIITKMKSRLHTGTLLTQFGTKSLIIKSHIAYDRLVGWLVKQEQGENVCKCLQLPPSSTL